MAGTNSRYTARRKGRRQDTDVRQQEQTADTAQRKRRRQNAEYRQQEQINDTARKRLQHDCHSVADLIRDFHTAVVCTSCDQLMYKHSVQKASIVRSLALSVTQSVLLDTVSSDGVEYVCNTCNKYLRRNQIPPCAIANNLQFPTVPSHLPTLTAAEWRLLSPRLAFMQIHEAAVGKLLRIHGNVVCVPADVCTTVNNLPRTSSDLELETIAIQLKRRSQYQHAFLASNVRPECIRQVGIRQVGTYLVDNGELFKHENISFRQQLLQSIQTTENSNTVSYTHLTLPTILRV